MKGYIPKNERKTILLLGDDLRSHSGIATMSREIIYKTAHHFNWVQIGGAIQNPDFGKVLVLDDQINNKLGISDASIKLYPWNGYGDPKIVRQIIEMDKIDGILHFTDPRYWTWLYAMERELRQQIPLMYYNIWDDLPYPYWNRPFYNSCDLLLSISKQTYNINKQVLKGCGKEDWQFEYVPHGIDHEIFKPLDSNDPELLRFKKEIYGDKEYDFNLLWNSRNIRRKNPGDIIVAFKLFLDQLPQDKANRCMLTMKTQGVDDNGTDLYAVIESIMGKHKNQVKIVNRFLEPEHMNLLYNLSDGHIFMSDNEGWGLGLTESVMAGRMIIAPVQGGMQDQMRFVDENGEWINFKEEWGTNADGRYRDHGVWALPIFPKTRSLKGSPPTPYIYSTQTSIEDAALRIAELYSLGPDTRKEYGLKGREWMMSDEANMTADAMGSSFVRKMDECFEKFEPRERFEIFKVDGVQSKVNTTPLSVSPEFTKQIKEILN